MLEKTKNFLKKECGKRVEPIDDYYLDICRKKGKNAQFLVVTLAAYSLTFEDVSGSVKM